MNYTQAINFLNSLVNHEVKRNEQYKKWNYNITRTRKLLNLLGNPDKNYKIFHVAGTNGKGTTAALFHTFLNNSGMKTGLFISPHILDIRERIQVNGKKISKSDFASITEKIKKIIDSLEDRPTYFECLTAIAAVYFSEMSCKWASFETGLGGRLDSTNALNSNITAITSISKDHTDKLGKTIKKITFEKAGIIKTGIPVVTGNLSNTAEKVIKKVSQNKNAPIYKYNLNFGFKHQVNGKLIFYPGDNEINPDDININLENLSIAYFCAKLAIDNVKFDLSNFNLPCRFQVISKNPDIILDGAHNEAAAENLVYKLKEKYPDKKIDFLISFLKSKDYKSFIKCIIKIAGSITVAKLDNPNDNSKKVFSYVKKNIKNAKLIDNTKKIIETLIKGKNTKNVLVATGSFYLCAEILNENKNL